MTPIGCAKALANFLQEHFDRIGYRPLDEKIARNKITICDGFLAKAVSAEEKRERDPYIVIRPVEVTDSNEGSVIRLQLLMMTYSSDQKMGHLDLYHLAEIVRQAVEQNPIIGEMYLLRMPVKTLIPEDQPWPEWWAYMELNYTLGRPGAHINQYLNPRTEV